MYTLAVTSQENVDTGKYSSVSTCDWWGSCSVLELRFTKRRIDWDDMMGEDVDYFSIWKRNKWSYHE